MLDTMKNLVEINNILIKNKLQNCLIFRRKNKSQSGKILRNSFG